MKINRPLLAGLLVLFASAPHASLVKTITVTTFDDENGGNAGACSLREAVRAVNTSAPFGGCPAGSALDDNLIKLPSGHYQLTLGELEIKAEVVIDGEDAQAEAHAEVENPLTGQAPRRFRPDYVDSDADIGETGTWIHAATGSRIAFSIAPLSLKDLVLVGSDDPSQATRVPVAGNGGVIYAGNSLALDNVIVRGGRVTGTTTAAGNGGAVYLAGDGTSLTLTDSTLEGNVAANRGGAIAMLCSLNLNPYALHSVTLTRSLLRNNSASLGAGAVEFCGNTTGNFTSTTLSANSSPAGSGALAYVHPTEIGIGALNFTYVTALEQQGAVLALGGVGNVLLTGSLLSQSSVVPRANVCLQVNPAVDMMTASPAQGSYNAIDNDGSCTALLSATGDNVAVAVGTDHLDYMVDIRVPADYYPSTPEGGPYGLSDYYLPRNVPGSPVLDRGELLESCQLIDQRNVSRKAGTACDIGAVERLVVTARDDEGTNRIDTDRVAIIDLLANDSFGENDITGPYEFAANTVAQPAVILVDDADGSCVWKLADAAENAGFLEVRNDGELTTTEAPVVCTYRVVDSSGTQSATTGTIEVQFKNASPKAADDAVLRRVGEQGVVFDPMVNDSDEGDGIYGLVRTEVPNDPLPPTVVYGPETAWAEFYPIEIQDEPQLGQVVGATSGICPGSSSQPRTCLTPPLRYIADNNLSPFTDSFTYRVYDADGDPSNAATVTVYTDAPDPDRGGGAGSLDWLWGVALGLLGLRRFRRL